MTAGPSAVPGTASVSGWVDAQMAEAQAAFAAQWSGVDAAFDARLVRTAEARNQAAAHAGSALRELENRRLSEAGYEALGAIDASRRIWTLWWHGDEPTTEE